MSDNSDNSDNPTRPVTDRDTPTEGVGVSEFARTTAGAASLVGKQLGNLDLVARLGVGGMGSVYQAEHRTLRTSYAVKILHGQFSSDEVAVERFRQEAISCSQLRHENVVFVTDFGFIDDLGLFITMEFLDGIPLGKLISRQGQLGFGRTVRIAEQIASAMSAAHRLQIVHRDLKPDNVMVLNDPTRADFIKVLDFGIAKVRGADSGLTNIGEAVGTPCYMSPESLVAKDEVGPATDIYALGCLLYEMLTGHPPFWQGSDFQILSAHVSETPAPVWKQRPELQGFRLADLIDDMLRKRPEDRPTSMQVVREELQAALMELVDKGVPSADYIPGAIDWSRTTGEVEAPIMLEQTIRLTGVVPRLREAAPNSTASELLDKLPETVSGSLLSLALWGVLQNELLENPVGSTEFQGAIDQTLLLTQAVLDSHHGEQRTRNQARFFRGIEFLLPQLSRDRSQILIRELRPLGSHPLFPAALLKQEHSGSWSAIRALLSTEISLRGFRRSDGELQFEDDTRTSERSSASSTSQAVVSLKHMSLMDKLKQDVSVKSFKSVLLHEIGSKRRPNPTDPALPPARLSEETEED